VQELKSARVALEQLKARKRILSERHRSVTESLTEAQTQYDKLLLLRVAVQDVAKATQQNLEYHISSLVSTALTSVFDDPYEFQLRFVERRGKTEADLIFTKNEQETDNILFSAGGGVADVASFALRVAVWSLKKTRPVLVLDETFKFLSAGLQHKASGMLKMLTEKLGLQIILVSHIPDIISKADKVFPFTNKNGIAALKGDDE